MENMLNLFNEQLEVQDSKNAQDLKVIEPCIEFKDVCFSYDGKRQILKNINFTVPIGHTVALVGESGAGKSSILKLLFRFYDVTSGSINISNVNIKDVTQTSVREAIGVVPQDTVLFNADITYNILYGRPSATHAEMIEAAKAAQIHDRIMSFPDGNLENNKGYNTKVGERGLRLSGGEKQVNSSFIFSE
jgi:ATP-binding cassette subfamily B (MDR/TAP) protein 6